MSAAPGSPGLRPLAALTAVVLLAHALALHEASLSLSPGDAPAPRAVAMNTRTVPPPPPEPAPAPVPAPRPPAPKAPKPPKPAAPPPAPAPAPAPSEAPVFQSISPDPSVERPESATDSIAYVTPTFAIPPPEAPPASPASAAAVEAGAPVDGASLNSEVPPSIRLLYDLEGQARGLDYRARGEVLWRHDGREYNLRLTVSAFLIGTRSQTSEGALTPQGLAPRRYADKWRGEQAAHLNRETGRITFSVNTPDAVLLPGAQDRLSLFIQLPALMAADPKRMAAGNRLTLQTVSTREAEPWIITADGEERLGLPIGNMTAFKFSRAPRRQYDSRLELWLAPELNYLPVRIRVTPANGDFVDQRLRAHEPVAAGN